jgi:polyisoprenyl-teichoic acid--peptidoglycan teichoic acid transferase
MDSLRRAPSPKLAPKPQLERPSLQVPEKVAPPTTLEPPQIDAPLYTKRPLRLKKLLFLLGITIVALLLLGVISFGIYFFGTLGTMQIKTKESPSFFSQVNTLTRVFQKDPASQLKQTSDGRINILLLGRAGESYPGKNLTDTIMIMSIDTEKHKVGLISLPRDLYITLDDERVSAKINSLYQYGLSQNKGTEMIQKAVTEVTNQPIHYTFILDFDGFEKIVNAFGGIQVEVLRDIYDERYPGKNYSYETFELSKGWQVLDGATALKYVRERHDDPEGDFGRAKRQQQVIAALKEKALSNSLLYNVDTLVKLLGILGESVKTDATLAEMESFFNLSKKLDTQNIETLVVDAWKKESLLRVSHVPMGGVNAFILVPRTGNWQEVQEASESIFSREQNLKRVENLESEKATVSILYRPKDRAQALHMERVLEDTLKQPVTLVPVTDYENWPEKSMLEDRTSLKKPWSLDTVIKKFALEKVDSLPLSIPAGIESDFIIVESDNTLNLPEEEFSTTTSTDETKEGEPLIIEN